jgi:protocatechuate 3,4-dioxygenase beta subunit
VADPTATLRLEGQVIDADQQPVAGALVALSTNPPRTVRSEADGTFLFTALPERALIVTAALEDQLGGPTVVALTDHTEPVILRMRAATTVEVVAFDVVTQRPLGGVVVELREPIPMQATTSPRGVARLRGVAPGPHQLILTAAGYAPSFPLLQSAVPGGAIQSLVVTMHPGVAVGGRVVDDAGHPIAGATVTGESAARAEPIADARTAPVTDADGRWRLAAVAPGTVRFRARDGQHAPGSSAPLNVDGKSALDGVDIVLSRGGRVAGHVVTHEGRPAPGASVRVGERGGPPLAEVRCDAEGAFDLSGLPRRTVELLAVGPEGSSRTESFDLGARAEETAARLSLDVDASIAGIVVKGDGTPVPEAQVSAIAQEGRGGALRDLPMTVTDGGGRFTLRGLPEGAYRLQAAFAAATSAARAPSELEVRTGERNARIVIDPDGGIRGEVAFQDGSAPDFYQVRLDGRVPVPFRATSVFHLTCPPGKHVLAIQGPGFREKTVTSIEVAVGKESDLGLQRLDRGRTVRGRVVSLGGKPIGGARVSSAALLIGDGSSLGAASGALGIGRVDTTTAPDGTFVLSGLGDRAFSIVAEHVTEGRSTPAPVSAGGDPAPLTLMLLPLGSLDGTVSRGGKPVENAVIAATSRAQGQARFIVKSGPDGRYRFDKLTPDEYAIAAGESDNQLDQRITTRVARVGEEPAHLDLELASGGASCRVRLPARGGEILNAQIYLASGALSAAVAGDLEQMILQRSEGTVHIGHIVRNGAVTFAQLTAGAYTLCTVPLPGDLSDPVVAQRIRDGAAALPVSCQPLQIPASAQPVEVVAALR